VPVSEGIFITEMVEYRNVLLRDFWQFNFVNITKQDELEGNSFLYFNIKNCTNSNFRLFTKINCWFGNPWLYHRFQYSFFDGKYTSFSLNNLDDQISKTYHSGYSIRGKHRKFNLLKFKVLSLFDVLTGITTPSLFFGTPGSYFGPHCEDFYLENINYKIFSFLFKNFYFNIN
jgi:hypothetical protein